MAKNITIAVSKLADGIARALDRARLLVEQSLTLSGTGAVLGGSVLFSHGIEELGKAKLLKDSLDNMRSQITGFGDHNTKLNTAAALLPPDYLTLFGGCFQRSALENDAFSIAIVTDWATRLESLYTDWNGNEWTTPPPLDQALLRDNAMRVLSFIANKQKEWCG